MSIARLTEEKKVIRRYKSFVLGICNCGCGESIPIRRVDGELMKFKYRHQSKGKESFRWNGGRYVDQKGYVRLHIPTHPNCNKNGYVFEHIKVMTEHLGRPLKKGEEVHHINEITGDNRLENLELLTKSQHAKKHWNGNDFRLGKHQDTSSRICHECGSKTTEMYKSLGKQHKTPYPMWCHLPHDKENWYCRKCYSRYNREKRKNGF